jgi:hypothetical protein
MKEKNSNWNEAIENSVKFIGESSQAYKMMHLLSAQKYSRLYSVIMYITLFLAPLTGTLATVSIFHSSSIPFNITIAILGYLTGILTAIIKFGKFHEKSTSHKLATNKYTSLESNVRRQLQLYRNDRVPSNEYFEWLSKSFDDLFLSSPFIDDYIYKKYYKLSVEKGLVFPNRYDNFITVEKNFNEPQIQEEIQIISEETSDEGSIKTENKPQKFNTLPRAKNDQNSISDLGRYGDQQMKYELGRNKPK